MKMELIIKNLIFIILGLLLTRHSQGQLDTTNSNDTKPHYMITTFINPPWVIKEDMGENNTELKGYIVDLVRMLADDLKFDYSLVLASDGKIGSKRTFDGSWDGVIGKVLNKDADIAAAPIEIIEQRRIVVEMTSPFLSSSKKILLQKPVPRHKSLLFILEPMTYGIWILVIVVNFAVGGMLYLINKFSPSEWSRVPSDQDPRGARDSFNPQNSFFFVHCTLTMQGYKELPRSPAGRILTACWFSFCLMIIISYAASYSALVIASNSYPLKPVIPFKSFQQMLSQTEVKYGLIGSDYVLSEMQNSDDEMLRRVYKSMDLNLISSSVKEGLEKIRDSDGKIAGIVDTLEAEFYARQDNCDMVFVGESILPVKYGFACASGSALCNTLSGSILLLRENGELQILKNKWLTNKDCPSYHSDRYVSAQETNILNFQALTISQTALAWIILLIGFVLGAVLLLIEVCIDKRKNKETNILNFQALTISQTALAWIILLIGFVLGAVLLLIEVCIDRRKNKKSRAPRSERQASRATPDEEGDEGAGDMGEKAPIAAAEP